MIHRNYRHHSRGVALLSALLVLFVMSILAIGMLSNVEEDIEMSKNEENSERALKIAEAGIQVARSSFFDPSQKNITQTEEISSVDGYIHGGYFMAYLASGIVGAEKWTQWRYDMGVTGNNTESEVSVPLRKVWATGALGTNGSLSTTKLTIKNLYGIVATGVYFPIEFDDTTNTTVDTKVRAHHEYTGSQKLTFWKYDKKLTNTTSPYDIKYASNMSPMATITEYSGGPTDDPDTQRLYFTYAGHKDAIGISSASDIDSTVRLRAVNAKDNVGDDPDVNLESAKTLWEFDTGMHGIGTAPTLFDPTPTKPGNGDEIIYFIVTSMGTPGDAKAHNLQSSSGAWRGYPNEVTEEAEQFYIYAVVDTGSGYKLKWATPYPDPDLANSTSYPTGHVVGTTSPSSVTGIDPPYLNRPSDMIFSLPENDLLPDYRDSDGIDGQHNLVRGNLFGANPQSVSPPIVNVLYENSSGNRVTSYSTATPASKNDPIIDIYVMYAAVSRAGYYRDANGIPWYYDDVRDENGSVGWGSPGIRKPNAVQTRVMSLRDRLVRNGTTWDWNSTQSRFPTFKWAYRVPGADPDQTDARPWNGYGEYSWDTWFDQQIAPMVRTTTVDQDATTLWTASTTNGTLDRYTIIYPYYRSMGYPTSSGYDHTDTGNNDGPTIAEGSPVAFDSQVWTLGQVQVMALRDTWDDYIAGNQTNASYDDMITNIWANATISNPVEPYWTYHNASYDSEDPNTTALTHPQYPDVDTSTYPNNTRIGFPRPYWWSETMWDTKVKAAAKTEEHSLFRQGWIGVGVDANDVDKRDSSKDVDIEGETAAICTDCLDDEGLMVLAFNHDLDSSAAGVDDREDLRVHGINATTGLHVWDYHMPASLAGDNANSTPAIANNKVFVAYMMYNAETKKDNRRALLEALDIETGERLQQTVVDPDADAVILSPTIANGVVYVGTYDYAGPNGQTQDKGSNCANWTCTTPGDDIIRLFAMSPVLRLVSTGIYPMDYQDKTGLTNYSSILKDEENDYALGVKSSRRKLQVWISGGESKWEEVKDTIE